MRILRSQVSLKLGIRPGTVRGKGKRTATERENIFRRMKGLSCGKGRTYFQKSVSRS